MKKLAEYKHGNTENSMVMTWKINSMTTDITARNFVVRIWEAVKERHLDGYNKAEVYGLGLIQDLRQKDTSVTLILQPI